MQWTIPIYRLYKDEHKDTIPQPANDESALWLDFVHNLITKLHTNVPRARSWCHHQHHHYYSHDHHNHNFKKNIFLENSNILYIFPKQGCFIFKNFAIQDLLAFMTTWLSSLKRDIIWIIQRDIWPARAHGV